MLTHSSLTIFLQNIMPKEQDLDLLSLNAVKFLISPTRFTVSIKPFSSVPFSKLFHLVLSYFPFIFQTAEAFTLKNKQLDGKKSLMQFIKKEVLQLYKSGIVEELLISVKQMDKHLLVLQRLLLTKLMLQLIKNTQFLMS